MESMGGTDMADVSMVLELVYMEQTGMAPVYIVKGGGQCLDDYGTC